MIKNNIKNTSLLFLSAVLVIGFTTSDSFATTTGGSVTAGSSFGAGGTFQLVTPPVPGPSLNCDPNSVGFNCQQTHDIWAFDEDQNIVLTSSLTVDDIVGDGLVNTAVLPIGTTVASHYVYYDPATDNTVQGCVQFDSPVLATIFLTDTLIDSDFLANTGVNYLSPGLRGFELITDSATFSGNEICVDFRAANPGDYFRVLTQFSPDALLEVEKSWTHTNYNWDEICEEVEVDTNVFEIVCRDRNIYNNGEESDPDDEVLANPFVISTVDMVDKYTAYAQVHKNDRFSNTNPGAFYALTTVVATSSLSSITVTENYDDCTNEEPIEDGDLGLRLHNENKPSRSVKAAIADPNGDVTEISGDLYNGNGGSITSIDENSAIVVIDREIEEGSTIFVLVKFQDTLRGYDTEDGVFDGMCHNVESVEANVGDNTFGPIDAEADLRITNDFDGDGIADKLDEFPLDNDNDGVNDIRDICPDTPTDEIANEFGCSPSQT